MKNIVKKIIPQKLLTLYRKMNLNKLIKKMYQDDMKRFVGAAFDYKKNLSQDNLLALITFNYHSLEKGLTNKNFRFGFGVRAYTTLIDCLKKYKSSGFDTNATQYQTGLSVIQAYINVHSQNGYSTNDIETKLTGLKTSQFSFGGVLELEKKQFEKCRNFDFKTLVFSRHSVRDFSGCSVKCEMLEEALSIANRTPSVCNRQSWQTYIIRDKSKIKEIMEIHRGLTGFGSGVDALFLVTTKNTAFSNITERNQGYVDGGMYSMSLLYALHYVGLAACALNANFTSPNDFILRKIVKIPDENSLIMFIAVGEYPDKFKVCRSKRNEINENTVWL